MYKHEWLTIDNIVYPCVVRGAHYSNMVVILFPGLFFPMSDRDYFMSRIASEVQRYATVYQFDLRGHGDHLYGPERTTLNGIKQDIQNILQKIVHDCGHPVFCIGRGISPLLCMQVEEESKSNLVSGVIGFNPYMLEGRHLTSISFEFESSKHKKLLRLCNYTNNLKFVSIMRALGAEIGYIAAESIPTTLIEQLSILDPQEVFLRFEGKKTFMFPQHDKNYTLKLIRNNDEFEYRDIDMREDSMLPYNSFWQSETIDLIQQMLYDWGENND